MDPLAALGLFRGPPDARPEAEIEADVCAELEHHLACAAADLVQEGRTSAEAEAEARRRFGDLDSIRRTCLGIQTGERIMLQRIHLALTVVLLFAVLFLAWSNHASSVAEAQAREMAMEARMQSEAQRLEALQAEQQSRLTAEQVRRELQARMQAYLERQKEAVEHIVIDVGDVLQIIDPYNEELHVIESVAADGKVLVPDAGWVPVAGLTREEVEERLNEACKPYFVQTDIKVKVTKPPGKDLRTLEFQAF